ncbi:hypothetical protein AB2063_002129 [Clostridium botulinum]
MEKKYFVIVPILDVGITTYQLPKVFTRFILLKDYLGIKILRTKNFLNCFLNQHDGLRKMKMKIIKRYLIF